MMGSSFRMVMTAKLGMVGEYVYILDKLLQPVVLDNLCQPVGWGPVVVLSIRSSCFVSIRLLNQYNELDYEENKLQVRLFDKQ